MRFGLPQAVIDNVSIVISRYPEIEAAIIFGSRAKGNFNPSSDIDIALKGKGVTLQTINSLSINLDDLMMPQKFDLTIYHRIANPELVAHIDRVGILLTGALKT